MKKRILIVDDDGLVRKGMRAYLEHYGLTVEDCGSGNEALALFREKGFDCVITDLAMPGMNGAELAVRLRELSKEVLIIGMSGLSDGSHFREAGVEEFLRKPVDMHTLVKLLE